MIFGGLADDVTGGVELAAILAGGGVDCDFVTDPALVDGDREAVVVAQKTRVAPARVAVERVRAGALALRRAGARQMFFKYCATFDSTPEGNIGPCADALLEATGAEGALFAPSFPEAERTVYQGHLFVGDRLVSESPKRLDPLTPMTDPDLVRVLARQTRRGVGSLPLRVLRAGADPAAEHVARLFASGVPYLIADAVEDADLARLADLTVTHPLMTGNSTVAGHYPALWRARGWAGPDPGPPDLPPVAGPGIVLAGSCAERTLEQLAVFGRERPVVTVDPLAAAETDPVAGLLERVLGLLAEGPVAVATSAAPDAVAAAQASLGVAGASRVAEGVLGRLAADLAGAGVRRFLVAGGETSGAVLEHLGVRRMQVGRYEEAGVGRAVAEESGMEKPDRLGLCLKSGKLGPPDMFLSTLRKLEVGGR